MPGSRGGTARAHGTRIGAADDEVPESPAATRPATARVAHKGGPTLHVIGWIVPGVRDDVYIAEAIHMVANRELTDRMYS